MITVFHNGIPYVNFISITASISLPNLSNSFQFTASSNGDFPNPKKGDLIEIHVDERKKVTGYVENIKGSEREGSHVITYSGGDRTADFIDSSVNVINDLNPSNNLTLKKILEVLISHIGADIKVIDLANPDPFVSTEDIITFQPGDNIADIGIAFARKRQCLLTSDENGNIVITRSLPNDSGQTLQNLIGKNDNNVFDQEWEIDSSNEFNKYIHRGQISPASLNFSEDQLSGTSENQFGEHIDSSIRSGRQKVVIEPKSFSSAQLKNRAKWSGQLAKAQATSYSCSLKGHSKFTKNEPWLINELAQVNSSAADITRKMLISNIVFSEGEGQPTLTTLTLVEQDVFTIDEKLANQKKVGSQNDAFKELK